MVPCWTLGHWRGRPIDEISLAEYDDRNNGHGKQGKTVIEGGHLRGRLIDGISQGTVTAEAELVKRQSVGGVG